MSLRRCAVKDESSVKIIMAAQFRTINRGGTSIYEEIRKAGYEPSDYIRFYHLRAYDRINAPWGMFPSTGLADMLLRYILRLLSQED